MVRVPRSSVLQVRVVPDGMDEVHGLKIPGTGLRGVIMVGTWRNSESVTFSVCHGNRPAVVLELTGQPFGMFDFTPVGIGLAIGFRPHAGPLQWLSVVGVLPNCPHVRPVSAAPEPAVA